MDVVAALVGPPCPTSEPTGPQDEKLATKDGGLPLSARDCPAPIGAQVAETTTIFPVEPSEPHIPADCLAERAVICELVSVFDFPR